MAFFKDFLKSLESNRFIFSPEWRIKIMSRLCFGKMTIIMAVKVSVGLFRPKVKGPSCLASPL